MATSHHTHQRAGFIRKSGVTSFTAFSGMTLAAVLAWNLAAPREARGQGYSWENAAGLNGGPGVRDATGSLARFDFPLGLVFSPTEAATFVCDYNNHCIRRVTPGGAVTTFAGAATGAQTLRRGHADGSLSNCRFDGPVGIAVAANGDLYIAEPTVIRRIAIATGTVETIAGAYGVAGTADGLGPDAQFWGAAGIAVTPDGLRVFVADSAGHTIRQIDRSVSPAVVTTIAGQPSAPGFANGSGPVSQFNAPAGLAWKNSTSQLFVTDSLNHAVRRVTAPAGGPVTVATIAGAPNFTGEPQADGIGAAAVFFNPSGIVFDPVADQLVVIDQFSLRTINLTTAQVTRAAGQFNNDTTGALGTSLDGSGLAASINPSNSVAGLTSGLTIDAAGNFILAESAQNQIRSLTPLFDVTTLAGRASSTAMFGGTSHGLPPWFANGPADTARFYNPLGMDSDAAGNIFVADSKNSSIRRIDAVTGEVSTVPGTAPAPSESEFYHLYYDVAAEPGGSVVCTLPQEARIVRPFALGAPIVVADSDDGFVMPSGIDVDAAGVIYVTDAQTNVIRSITPGGTITTIAGTGDLGFADGPGTTATFGRPTDVVVRADGVLFVADNFFSIIRRLTPGPLGPLGPYDVTTISGTPNVNGVNDGPAAAALYNSPEQLALDSSNQLFITDTGNGLIRRFNLTTGRVKTIGGDPSLGFVPALVNQGGLGPDSLLMGARGVAVNPSGDVFVSSFPGSGVWRGTRDSTPPVTTLIDKPGNPTFAQEDTFGFTASEPNCSWEISLDGGPFIPASGPASHSLSGLSDGPHTVLVRAIDAAGNEELAPVSWTWTIQSYARDWRQLHFGTTLNEGDAADSADPDADGIDNLLERAFGLDPNGPSTLPVTNTTLPSGIMHVVFTRRVDALLEIKTQVHWSELLLPGTWSDAGVIQTVISTAGNIETVEAIVPAGQFRRFTRVEAELLPPP